MRERLIEILREPVPVINGYNAIGVSRMSIVDAEKAADRLLENGVIVPPCKVGDVVYRILYGRIYKFKIAEIVRFMRGEQYFFEFLCCVGPSFSSYDFGKTVFFTSEEAEQALKEGVQGWQKN